MGEWQIRIPHNGRDQTPIEALTSNVEDAIPDPEERRIATHLLFDAACDPDIDTTGDLLDKVEGATPEERRAILDQARESAGLPSTAKVEGQRAVEFYSRPRDSGPLRDSQGRISAVCSEPGCRMFAPEPGMAAVIRRVACKRWYCAEHREGHEADLEPWDGEMRASLSMSGKGFRIVAEDEREAERQRVQVESLRHQREAEEAQRRADAERLKPFEEANREAFRRQMPKGIAG